MKKKEYQDYHKSHEFVRGTHNYPKMCFHCMAEIERVANIRVYFVETYKLNACGNKTKGRHIYFHDDCWLELAGEDYVMDW